LYQVINMANSVIRYAPDVQANDDTYTVEAMYSHQTEAYFMRALMYFYLVRNFKEVPLVLTPYVDDTAPFSIAKSTEAEIIAQIKADITTALDSNAAKEFYDDDTWAGATKGRATKWALYALMADVCLWSEDYDTCIRYADYLINATSAIRPAFMSIPEQWFTIFYPGNSNESIFELNWDYSTYNQTANSPSAYFTSAENASLQFSPDMVERLKTEDDEVLLLGRETVRGMSYMLVTGSNPDFPSACIWKYTGTGATAVDARPQKDANFIIYRMADVMLMKAEALIWKGESNWPAALDIINQIHNRANLNDIVVDFDDIDEWGMLEILLNERDLELAAEGKRWYDLLRLGKTQNYKYKEEFIALMADYNTAVNDSWIRSVLKNTNAWYLPIYESEITTNDLLVQNPYYAVTNNN
jgi:hypothetical protein